MKSIKRGRGPSMMGGVVGIFMIVIGIAWTIGASAGGPIFALFGIAWTCIAVVITVHNFKDATSRNRHSLYDIVDASEEPDPLNERFGGAPDVQDAPVKPDGENKFCPYCGAAVEGDFRYCNSCGKKLP